MFLCIGPDGEPKVTHGHTLVSELTLVEVAKVINVSLICCNAINHKSFHCTLTKMFHHGSYKSDKYACDYMLNTPQQ